MIYGKLPVSFLSAIDSEKNGSTNSAIAHTLLQNLDAARGMGIKELAAPRIWMVTGEKRPPEDFIDGQIWFPSAHTQAGHPYQLLWMAGMIAQEYAACLEEEEENNGTRR